MGEAAIITLFSMGVVFLTLVVISLILDLFKIIFKEKKPQTNPAPAIESQAPMKAEQDEQDKQDELIAIITGAIAAYTQTPKSKLIIKSIKPIKSQEPIWAQIGRLDQMK